jgi:hypothetical protein
MTTPVFLSCPTTLTEPQAAFHEQLVGLLNEAGFQARSVGRTDFGNSVPLVTIRVPTLWPGRRACSRKRLSARLRLHVEAKDADRQ